MFFFSTPKIQNESSGGSICSYLSLAKGHRYVDGGRRRFAGGRRALYVANRYIPVLYIPQLVTATSLTAETASASATTMNVMGSTTAITVPTKMAALVRTLRYSLFEVSYSMLKIQKAG